jgi:hypothetical protein
VLAEERVVRAEAEDHAAAGGDEHPPRHHAAEDVASHPRRGVAQQHADVLDADGRQAEPPERQEGDGGAEQRIAVGEGPPMAEEGVRVPQRRVRAERVLYPVDRPRLEQRVEAVVGVVVEQQHEGPGGGDRQRARHHRHDDALCDRRERGGPEVES